MKKNIFKIIFILISVFLMISCKSNEQKVKDITIQMGLQRYDEARELTRKYFKSNSIEYQSYMLAIDEYEGDIYSREFLFIEPGWTWKIEYGHDSIDGKVRNYGKETIRYFEVKVDYLDNNGNIVDSNYTNSGQDLEPNAMKVFNIINAHSSNAKKARLQVGKVLLK